MKSLLLLRLPLLILPLLLSACVDLNLDSDSDNNPDTTEQKNPNPTLQDTDGDELLRFVKSALKEENANQYKYSFAQDDVALESAAVTDDGANTSAGGAPITSTTNVQEKGVDEQDVIKVLADQRILYSVFNTRTKKLLNNQGEEYSGSYSTNPTNTELQDYYNQGYKFDYVTEYGIKTTRYDETGANLSSLQKISSQKQIKGLYLYQDQLAAIEHGGWDIWGNWFTPYYYGNQTTRLAIYDIESDGQLNTTPEELAFEGTLVSSRSIGHTLYLVLRHYPELSYKEGEIAYDDITLEDVLPNYKVNNADKGIAVQPNNCLLNEDATTGASVITLLAIDTSTEDFQFKSQCYIGSAEALYTSTNAMYLASTQWDYGDGYNYDPKITTDIHKFAFEDGGFDYQGTGSVKGHLGWNQDQKSFRFSEHNGDLRVITYDPQTNWFTFDVAEIAVATDQTDDTTTDNNSNSAADSSEQNIPTAKSPARLTILRADENKEKLEALATLPNDNRPALLGKEGEQLYATQFMGDKAFLVTYRVTDPLYVLNLSDPTDPFIEGELEIDGWSDYLYSVGNDLLLGIGKDAIVEDSNGWQAAWYQGVKLSLIDISDPTNPTEVDKAVIGKRGTQSQTLYDHHAYTQLNLQDSTKVALPIRVHETEYDNGYGQGQAWQWYQYSYTGLFRYEVDTVNKELKQIGNPVISHQNTSNEDYYYHSYGKQRSRIIGDSIHYLYNGNFYSQDWAGNQEIVITE